MENKNTVKPFKVMQDRVHHFLVLQYLSSAYNLYCNLHLCLVNVASTNSNCSSEFRTELHINVLQEILLKIFSINCMHTQWLAFIINLLFYMPDSNSEVMSVKVRKKILAEQYPNVFQF